MNQGPISGRYMKKTRGQKSHATVPLTKNKDSLVTRDQGKTRHRTYVDKRQPKHICLDQDKTQGF